MSEQHELSIYRFDTYIEESYLGVEPDNDNYVEDPIPYPSVSVRDAYRYRMWEDVFLVRIGVHDLLDRMLMYPVDYITEEAKPHPQNPNEDETVYRVHLANAQGVNVNLVYGSEIMLYQHDELQIRCETPTEKVLWGLYLKEKYLQGKYLREK